MRIAYYNRPDNKVQGGGDTIQMDNTAAAVQAKYGAEIKDFSQSTPQELLDWKPDIVHVFNMQPATYHFIRAIKGHPDCPPIVLSTIYLSLSQLHWAQRMMHMAFNGNSWALERMKDRTGYMPKPPENGIPYADILSMVDGWLPNGFAELYDIRKDFNVPVKPFAVVPNAVSKDFLSDNPLTVSTALIEAIGKLPKPFIVTVGRIEPRKNQAMLAYAMKDLDIPIVCVGQKTDGGYLSILQGIKDNIFSIEQLSHGDLKYIYGLDCIYALPSWLESPSLATMEALASGCPVVIGNQGSEYEYFDNFAIYVDPANPEEIRNKILHAIENRVQLREAVKPYREEAKKLFTWDNAAIVTYGFYQQILQ